MDEQRLKDQLEPIYISVLIQEVARKISSEQWTIGTGGERGSRRSVLAAQHDDDDDDDDLNKEQDLILPRFGGSNSEGSGFTLRSSVPLL